MRFIIEYGCEITTEYLAIETESLEDAMDFAETEAWRLRESYEGLHGVLDYEEFCEDRELDPNNEDNWEEYAEIIRYEISYGAHEFDDNDEEDISILRDCDWQFFEV